MLPASEGHFERSQLINFVVVLTIWSRPEYDNHVEQALSLRSNMSMIGETTSYYHKMEYP
jgi:hypothetical protein